MNRRLSTSSFAWRLLAVVTALAAGAAVVAPGAGSHAAETQPAAAAATKPATEPAPDVPPAVRFEVVDVFVDTGDKPLAAYQFTLSAVGADVRLVSLEGGDHPSLTAPPYYDKQALMTERIVIAGFSTNAELPAGRVRVCRLHVQVTGDGPVKYSAELHAAAGPNGEPIAAKVMAGTAAGD